MRLKLIHSLAKGILLAITGCVFVPLGTGQTLETLHWFQGSDGGRVRARLIQRNDGCFYGTTVTGGEHGYGTVFKMGTNWDVTVLVAFDYYTNGASPYAGLVEATDGNLYGTTRDGGTNGCGTAFRISPDGALTTLVTFNRSKGMNPEGGLVQGSDGYLYGTTEGGGASIFDPTIFRMTTNGELTTLVSVLSTNGQLPQGELVQGKDGCFYGVTIAGGSSYVGGTVFRMTTNGDLTTLVSFNGTNGSYPTGLIQASDGNFYGTTGEGGEYGAGTGFKMTPAGTLTALVSFNRDNGEYPTGTLTQGSDGDFYGTTLFNRQNIGTVFRMTTNGLVTTLVSCGSDPVSGVVEGSDGNLYGTTAADPVWGTIFRVVMPVFLNAKQERNYLILSWPTNRIGFTLQSTLNLTPPVAWTNPTNAPVVVGAQFLVTNSINGNARFYRLKK